MGFFFIILLFLLRLFLTFFNVSFRYSSLNRFTPIGARTCHDHIESVRVIERGDSTVDAVVGAMISRVQSDDVTNEQCLAVLTVLAAGDPTPQLLLETNLFAHTPRLKSISKVSK